MKMIKKIAGTILNLPKEINLGLAEIRHNYRRKKLLNTDISILCNDCTGGIISHDLKLRFASPTVNLFFESNADFIRYMQHLREYNNCEIVEDRTKSAEVEWPVGILKSNAWGDITLHFRHYMDFKSARIKWMERCSRINYDKIYCILHTGQLEEKDYLEFEKLTVAHKIIITYKDSTKNMCKDVYVVRGMERFEPAKLLKYKGVNGKRYLDEFDYVKFLNLGTEEKYE